MKIKNSSVVRLKFEVCSEGERAFVFAVQNLDVEHNRCDIVCLNSDLPLTSIETITLDMIESTGLTVEDDILPFKLF